MYFWSSHLKCYEFSFDHIIKTVEYDHSLKILQFQLISPDAINEHCRSFLFLRLVTHSTLARGTRALFARTPQIGTSLKIENRNSGRMVIHKIPSQ